MADTSPYFNNNNGSIWSAVGQIAPAVGAAVPGILAPVAANQAAGGYSKAANTVGTGINTSATALNPYQVGGVNANATLQSLFGINGQPANAAAVAAFENTPGFKFQEEMGDQGIQRAANASGNGFSSSTLAALDQYNSGLAATTYQNYISNLFGLNSTGENAAVARGSQAIQGANYQGNFQVGRGNAVAGGISGAAGAIPGITAALPGAISGISRLFGGGGGGGGGAPYDNGGGIYDPNTGEYGNGFMPGSFGSPDYSPYVSNGPAPTGYVDPSQITGVPNWFSSDSSGP